MPCICAIEGKWTSPGEVLPLTGLETSIKNRLNTIGNAIVGVFGPAPPRRPEDLLRMEIRRSNLPSNQMVVGLQSTDHRVTWKKELSAWNVCSQKKRRTIFIEDLQRELITIRIEKSVCSQGTDTIILSKTAGPLYIMHDMYNFEPDAFWRILGGTTVTFNWLWDGYPRPEEEAEDSGSGSSGLEVTGPSQRIRCVRKDEEGNVSALGGVTTEGRNWVLGSSEIIRKIEQGEHFWVEEPAGDPVDVVIATRDGRKYLKTERDGDRPNNLLSLPGCP